MTEKDTEQFKIRLDDDYEDRAIKEKEDLEGVQSNNLNQRIIILVIFIMCLLGILMGVAYIDVKKRINSIHTTGSTQVQNLSQDVESRLSDLSTQAKTLKDLIKTETASLKKEIDLVTINLDKNKTYLKKTEKSGKKELEKSISTIHKKITLMEKNLNTIDGNVKRELAIYRDALDIAEKELTSTKSDISFLSKKRIEQEKVGLAHDIQQKRFHQDLDQIKKDIDNRLNEIKKKIQTLENKTPPLAKSGSTPSIPLPSKPPQPTPKASEGIIEQDISE